MSTRGTTWLIWRVTLGSQTRSLEKGAGVNVRVVRELVEEVLLTCRWDETGVTSSLVDLALNAAIEIGMSEEEIRELASE
jgi:hypothetical protein